MRLNEVLDALTDAQSASVASVWKAQPGSPALAAAMRAPAAWNTIKKACASGAMIEDALLLCANPFDVVEEDEVVDAARLGEIGLLGPLEDGGLEVNLDLAIACVPKISLEFGFFATLFARLDEDDRAAVSRAMEVGPRPSIVDSVLDCALAASARTTVMRHVAHLKEADRAVLHEGIALGDLPDDLDALDLGAKAPSVRLDDSPAGRRGLAFRIDYPAAGLRDRVIIPIELLAILPDILAQVPPPPETMEAKPSRRGAGTRRRKRSDASGASRATKAVVDAGAATTAAQPVTEALSGSGVFTRLPTTTGPMAAIRDPLAASGPNSPYRLGRVSSIRAAGAVVDVETAKIAEAVMKDSQLAGDVIEVLNGSLVVLASGVDARGWAESCALRLGL